jgi:alkyl hydroperoxide reductase subunit AhpF
MQFGEPEKREVRKAFDGLKGKVRLVNFTQEVECMYCRETRDLVKQVSDLSEMVECEVYDFQIDRDRVQELGVDKIPATVVLGEKDYGIKFYGIPAGYEFSSFIDAIRMVSVGESGLSEDSIASLKELENPVHFQVFVTPT